MKTLLVVGASGFVGRHLALALLRDGYRVRCLARTPSRVEDLAKAGCEIVQGDICDARSVASAVATVDAVYLSIHTLSTQPASAAGQGFMDVERSGLETVVSACHTADVRRLIYVTFLGIAPDAPSAWVRGRWDAEQFLLNSGLDVTVLRPGQIVGVGGRGFDMMLANAKKPVALLMANARQRNRNIAVDDLIYYLVGVLEEPRAYGQCYDVGCDDVLTNDQMTDIAAEVLGRRHPVKLHIPMRLLRPLAPMIERRGKLPPGAITGIVDSLGTDAVGDPAPIRAILQRPPLAYREAVARALRPAAY